MSEPRTAPAFRLKAKLKVNHPDRYPWEVGTAWPKDRGQGFNFSLPRGAKIVLADGTEITGGKEGNCWLDLYENTLPAPGTMPQPRASATFKGGGSAKHTGTPEPDYDSGKEPPDGDDIPF